ncbi:MAG: Clp protease N-terminal domain-containing protein, partial [Candidatus Omnitrophota bacterium]
MFNRFTERARKVILLAKEEAKRFNHDYIGTEHILLGLIREGEGVAAAVLASLGLNSDKIRFEIEKLVHPGPTTIVSGDIPFTPKAKRVIELAMEEARQLGHNYIGTEHLLLGLIREGEGVASQVLMNLGLDLDKVRAEVMNLLGSSIPGLNQGQKTKKGKTPALDAFGRDLTKLAKEGKLDPVIGRQNEIERIIQILARRTKNNPVLLGEAGVGKTAIVEGLAEKIIENNIPEILRNKRIMMLDLALMVAGTKYRGQFEERIKAVMEEIKNSPDIIVFIDELHTLVGAGGAEGAIDASNILKPALSRGEIQCVGATTIDEYRKHIEKDAALERRFQTIVVEPSTVEETIEILNGLRDRYEAHHKVKFLDSALEGAAKLSDRYISGRFLPDKAIDLMDEAGSRVRLSTMTAPPDIKNIESKIEKLKEEKEDAV